MKYHLSFLDVTEEYMITRLETTYRPQKGDRLILSRSPKGSGDMVFVGKVKKVSKAEVDLRKPLPTLIGLTVYLSGEWTYEDMLEDYGDSDEADALEADEDEW
jgi:hypothetical protein